MFSQEVANMSTELSGKKCIPCQSGTDPLKGKQLQELADQIPAWDVEDEHHIERLFKFQNFVDALEFTNRVGELAEQENHHPEIFLTWGKVIVTLWTHKIDGLSESDFVLAAKIDELEGAQDPDA
jgi:4a-hydroxytetrahydrobiopterin dehydratase